MKKFFTLAAVAMMSLSAMATVLFEGDQYVTWGKGVQFDSTKFAGLTVPQELIVTYEDATDGIEFKRLDVWDQLYFGQFQGITGNGSITKVLTIDALNNLAKTGLEIIGANFYLEKVELVPNTTDYNNHLWKGFFWMDEWSTIEMKKDWYTSIDWTKYEAIRFVSEANRTDYVINVMTSWEAADKLGDQNTMTMTNEYAELTLTDAIRTKLAASEQLMVQCNKEQGNAFNMTDIILVPKSATGIQNNAEVKATKFVENGQIVILKNGVKYNAVGAQL